MKFALTDEQTGFARSLDDLLSKADTAAVNRAWADGDHEPGLKLWSRLADLGVTVLATEATPVEVCIAFEALGRHAVPGPWIESAAYLPIALPDEDFSEKRGHRRRCRTPWTPTSPTRSTPSSTAPSTRRRSATA